MRFKKCLIALLYIWMLLGCVGISVALALTELYIARKKRGACRIHGGGFAGVIMAMLPNDITDEYISYIEKALGEGSAYRMSIRPYGAVCVNDVI